MYFFEGSMSSTKTLLKKIHTLSPRGLIFYDCNNFIFLPYTHLNNILEREATKNLCDT